MFILVPDPFSNSLKEDRQKIPARLVILFIPIVVTATGKRSENADDRKPRIKAYRRYYQIPRTANTLSPILRYFKRHIEKFFVFFRNRSGFGIKKPRFPGIFRPAPLPPGKSVARQGQPVAAAAPDCPTGERLPCPEACLARPVLMP